MLQTMLEKPTLTNHKLPLDFVPILPLHRADKELLPFTPAGAEQTNYVSIFRFQILLITSQTHLIIHLTIRFHARL